MTAKKGLFPNVSEEKATNHSSRRWSSLGSAKSLASFTSFHFALHGITLCWHYIVNVIFCRLLKWTKDKFLATAQNRGVVFSHCQKTCSICRLMISLAF